MIVYSARWLLPVTAPPLQNGSVAVRDERIVAVGRRDDVLAAVGHGAELRELGLAVICPGLVNAHAHFELAYMGADRPPPGDYVGWVRGLLARREREDEPLAVAAMHHALTAAAARGTVAVGDISNQAWSPSVLAGSALHGVAFHEIYGFRAQEATRLLGRATERLARLSRGREIIAARERLTLALTPHGAHTTSANLLRALARAAAAASRPLSVHVAESPAEAALLGDGSGPLATLLRERGQWDESWVPPGVSPVGYLDRLGVLTPRTLAVHCVQLRPRDHATLLARGVTVVTCPRSNRYLGVGRAPIPQLARAGVPVAIGTDALASAPDADMFGEMAALREEHPTLSPAAVLRMATLNGAVALGLDPRLGSIEPGKLARLLVLPLVAASDDPLELLSARPAVVHALATAPSEECPA